MIDTRFPEAQLQEWLHRRLANGDLADHIENLDDIKTMFRKLGVELSK